MNKELTVEELRHKADALIDAIEHGETVTIVRNGQPIGSYSPWPVTQGVAYPLRNLQIAPLMTPLGIDPVDALVGDRQRERSGKKYGL